MLLPACGCCVVADVSGSWSSALQETMRHGAWQTLYVGGVCKNVSDGSPLHKLSGLKDYIDKDKNQHVHCNHVLHDDRWHMARGDVCAPEKHSTSCRLYGTCTEERHADCRVPYGRVSIGIVIICSIDHAE